MKHLKITVLIILIFSVSKIFSQTVSQTVVEAGVKKMSTNIASVMTKTKSETIKIIVLPFYDYNGKLMSQSEEIGKGIAHQLNLDLKQKGWKYEVWYYTDFDNKDLSNLANNTDMGERDAQYYTNLLKMFSPDYIVSGSYSVDNSANKFYLQNVNIYQNWISSSNNVVSAQNVEIDIDMPNKSDYAMRSAIVPGWGQIYKEQKSKGTFLLAGFGVLASTTIISQAVYSYNNKQYLNYAAKGSLTSANIYKSNADSWSVIRNINLVALGGIYVYNLIDAVTVKNKKYYSFQFSPQFIENKFAIGFCYKF